MWVPTMRGSLDLAALLFKGQHSIFEQGMDDNGSGDTNCAGVDDAEIANQAELVRIYRYILKPDMTPVFMLPVPDACW